LFEYICFFFLLIFAIFGFCEAAHLLKILLLFPKRRMNSQLVIRLDNKNAEKQLIFAGEQYLWLGNKLADSVLAVNSNLDKATYLKCKEIAKKYNILFP
jgi:hypothetical protein